MKTQGVQEYQVKHGVTMPLQKTQRQMRFSEEKKKKKKKKDKRGIVILCKNLKWITPSSCSLFFAELLNRIILMEKHEDVKKTD